MASVPCSRILSQIDRTLALDPTFGQPIAIVDDVAEVTERCLSAASAHSVRLTDFVGALVGADPHIRLCTLCDPIVRAEARSAIETLRFGDFDTDNRDEFWATCVSVVTTGLRRSPLEAAMPRSVLLCDSIHSPFLWTGGDFAPHLARRFAQLLERGIAPAYGTGQLALSPPSEAVETNIKRGWRLLEDLLPELARSIAPHIHIVALVDTVRSDPRASPETSNLFESLTLHSLPGAVFLSPSAADYPLHAAEALFHEGLHNKLYDLYLSRAILREDYDTSRADRITARPHAQPAADEETWPYDRALAAFHFYAHLTLFCAAARERRVGPDGARSMDQRLADSLDRARFLGVQLRAGADRHLAPHGRDLIDWLLGEVERLAALER